MEETNNSWKFDQEPKVGAITTKQVLEEDQPILLVIHYGDDCSWAFLCDTTDEEQDSRMITMEQAVQLDPTLEKLANLPPGWIAYRDFIGDDWARVPEEDYD